MTTNPIEAALRRRGPRLSSRRRAMASAIARAERRGWSTWPTPPPTARSGPLLVAATEPASCGSPSSARTTTTCCGAGRRGSHRGWSALAGRLDEIRRELDEYFEGRRDHFDLPLDWRLSVGFRKTVLEHLYADVPYGRTVSYLELATMVGNPKAARAVGTAMATNPIPIVVPCHRVLRTGGQLGGYGGGLPSKLQLLELEAGEPRSSDQAGARTSEPLWPPKPKLFEMVGPGSQARGSPITRSIWGSSGSTSVVIAVGGIRRRRIDSITATASMAPAAPRECPVTPLIEVTGGPGETEQLVERLGLGGVVQRGGGAVSVDLADVASVEAGVRPARSPCRTAHHARPGRAR